MPKTKQSKTKKEKQTTVPKNDIASKNSGQEDKSRPKRKHPEKTSKKTSEDHQSFLPVIHQGENTQISLEIVKKGTDRKSVV